MPQQPLPLAPIVFGGQVGLQERPKHPCKLVGKRGRKHQHEAGAKPGTIQGPFAGLRAVSEGGSAVPE